MKSKKLNQYPITQNKHWSANFNKTASNRHKINIAANKCDCACCWTYLSNIIIK